MENNKVNLEDFERVVSENEVILKEMGEEGKSVFSLVYCDSKEIKIYEECDGYFSATLNKEKCLALSKVFSDLAEIMK